MIDIRRNDIETSCAVCGRTLLLGERLVPYESPEGAETRVCELCVDQADALGWIREGSISVPLQLQSARNRPRGLKGFLAGFPMVDFQVELFDGQYHDVDSSEMSFKIAGSLAYKDAVAKCRPTILEPVMKVEIAVPEEYAGAVMGDLSSRRGRPQGMEPRGSLQVIKAEVPLSEMLSYDAELTSMTGARGSYHMEMSHYDEVPGQLAEKVVTAAKAEKEKA